VYALLSSQWLTYWQLYSKWVIIDDVVYNLSKFADLHPGGASVLLDEEVGQYRSVMAVASTLMLTNGIQLDRTPQEPSMGCIVRKSSHDLNTRVFASGFSREVALAPGMQEAKIQILVRDR